MSVSKMHPDETPDFLETDLRTASFVDRWGIGRMLGPRSLSDHSFFTTVYSIQVADIIQWEGSYSALVMWAIAHDCEEIATGDVMGFFKRAAIDTPKSNGFVTHEVTHRFGSFVGDMLLDRIEGKINSEILSIVKVADNLDDACRLQIEAQMGNHSMHHVFHSNIMPALEASWMALPGDKQWLQMLFQTKVKPRVDAHYLEPVRAFSPMASAERTDARASSGG